MSMFGGLFGKSKNAPAPAPAPPPAAPPGGSAAKPTAQTGIAKAKEQIDVLNKRIAHINRKMDVELKNAKEAQAKGDKATAMMCMKRRKTYENQRNTAMNAITNLEGQQQALEQMIITKEIVAATEVTASAIKNETESLSADKVDRVMDEAEEGMADVREITEAMNRVMDTGVDADEDDLMAELAQMTESQAESEIVGGLTSMPEAPNTEVAMPVPSKQIDEDAELKRLEAEMGM